MFRLLAGALALSAGIALTGCDASNDAKTDASTAGGGGGGSAPAVADGTSGLTVSGQVYDGPVSGATVTFYSDAALQLPIAGVSATTDFSGKFTATVPGGAVKGLSYVYARSHGGQDQESLDPPLDMAAPVDTTRSGKTSLTPANALVMKMLAADRNATVEQARTQVKALFGQDESFSLDPGEVLIGSELAVIAKLLIKTGAKVHPEIGGTAGRADATLNDLAAAAASGFTNVTALAGVLNDMNSNGQGDGRVHVRSTPEFELSAVTVSAQRHDLATLAIATASDGLPELSLRAAPPSPGSTGLPDVTLSWSRKSDNTTPTHFAGAVEMQIRATSNGSSTNDPRLLTLKFDGVRLTSPGATDLEVMTNAAFSAGGTDASGGVVSSVSVTATPSNAPDLMTTTATVSDREITFHMAAVLAQIQAKLNGVPSGHPATLLDGQTVVDVGIAFRGIPTRTAKGRVRRVLVLGTRSS
jgi:hypothetical protein